MAKKKTPTQTSQELRGSSAGTGMGFECRNYSDSRLISAAAQRVTWIRLQHWFSRGFEPEFFLLLDARCVCDMIHRSRASTSLRSNQRRVHFTERRTQRLKPAPTL
jgi:hypothetical protein